MKDDRKMVVTEGCVFIFLKMQLKNQPGVEQHKNPCASGWIIKFEAKTVFLFKRKNMRIIACYGQPVESFLWL